ncbi:hypothetical protein FMN50_12085 [Rhodobacterales bacterium]|nr:hypothetical protein FMN50_12085 [Rhodobacterales bacterium]
MYRGWFLASPCARAVILGSALAFALPASSSFAQEENAKWFVLKHEKSGECWTGLLIEIDGEYRHEFALTAGGPFDTKDEALEREKQLENVAVCTSTEAN